MSGPALPRPVPRPEQQPTHESGEADHRPNPPEVTRSTGSGDCITQLDLNDFVAATGLESQIGNHRVGCGRRIDIRLNQLGSEPRSNQDLTDQLDAPGLGPDEHTMAAQVAPVGAVSGWHFGAEYRSPQQPN